MGIGVRKKEYLCGRKLTIITMINRALIRTKTVQLVFSWQNNPQPDTALAIKQLNLSLNKTYELYHWMLLLSVEITKYAIKRIEFGLNKLRPTEEELNPNKRFINNKFYKQLLANKQLAEYARQNGLGWDDDNEIIKTMYDAILESDIYKEYMTATKASYEDDKMVWRKIYRKIFAESEALQSQLEDMDIYWNDDLDTVLSFIEKTIKHFTPESDENEELLPMFRDETDRDFAIELVTKTVENKAEYEKLIADTAKNWEIERIASMEMAILTVGIAEIANFPAIPVSVSINEYLEIAKSYSNGDKSKTFVNGVLDAVANKLKKEGKLIKVAVIKNNN